MEIKFRTEQHITPSISAFFCYEQSKSCKIFTVHFGRLAGFTSTFKLHCPSINTRIRYEINNQFMKPNDKIPRRFSSKRAKTSQQKPYDNNSGYCQLASTNEWNKNENRCAFLEFSHWTDPTKTDWLSTLWLFACMGKTRNWAHSPLTNYPAACWGGGFLTVSHSTIVMILYSTHYTHETTIVWGK